MHTTVTPLGLGTFPFSSVFSDVSQEIAAAIIEEYLNLGGNYIETAPIYPKKSVDLSEIFRHLGRSRFLVATKCALAIKDGGAVRSGKRDFLRQQVEGELKRLGLQRLDLVQTHITPTDVTPEELGENLMSLRENGLVTSVGCSNISLPDLKRVASTCAVEWVQLRLSIVHRFEYLEISDLCSSNGISLNVFQVIERGQFEEGSNNRRESSDLRNSKQEYIGEPDQIIRRWFKSMESSYPKHNTPLARIPISWALSQSAVRCAVVGATTTAQVRDNWNAAIAMPTKEELAFVDNSFSALERSVFEEYGRTLREIRGVERQK